MSCYQNLLMPIPIKKEKKKGNTWTWSMLTPTTLFVTVCGAELNVISWVN